MPSPNSPFVPGNQIAAKEKRIRAALVEAMDNAPSRADGLAGMKAMCVDWVKFVTDDSIRFDERLAAAKEVRDTLDGKPQQSTEISGPAGGPVQYVVMPEITREEWFRLHAQTVDKS